jgi:predicted membrane channel-forming protein YqfA (hemolysin III family)
MMHFLGLTLFSRLTFKRVIKEASVGEFSCVPYILALFSTLTYSWYGFPLPSRELWKGKSDNLWHLLIICARHLVEALV